MGKDGRTEAPEPGPRTVRMFPGPAPNRPIHSTQLPGSSCLLTAFSPPSGGAEGVCGWRWGAQSPRSFLGGRGATSEDERRSRARVRAPEERSGASRSVPRMALSARSRLAGRRPSSARQVSGETRSAAGSCSQPHFITSRSLNLPFLSSSVSPKSQRQTTELQPEPLFRSVLLFF